MVGEIEKSLRDSLSFRALEPRIAFDAAAVATIQDATGPGSGAPDGETDATLQATTDPIDIAEAAAAVAPEGGSTAVEIVFVDSAVRDASSLLSGLSPNAEIVFLQADRDGVEQIAEALAGRDGIDAIHILSHGTPGTLILGNATLTASSMQGEHLDELNAIGAALSADGDILIYGCDYTADEVGLEAAMILGGITGADIAASTDTTGYLGDWVLETQIGSIETVVAVDAEHAAAYSSQLNTAPVGQDTAVEVQFDAYVFKISDFPFTDIDGNALASVRITSLPSEGTIRLDGQAVTVGQEVGAVDIVTGRLVYSVSAGSNQPTMFSVASFDPTFTFQVRDSGASNTLDVTSRIMTLKFADTDGDGIRNTWDMDDDNDGISDLDEQTIWLAPPLTPDSITFSYAQDTLGYGSRHDAASVFKTGDRNDPAFLFDNEIATELRVHQADIYEFSLDRTLGSGSTLQLTEGTGGNDAAIAVFGTQGTTDAAGNTNNATGGGQGWATLSAKFGVTSISQIQALFAANGNQPLVSADGKAVLLYAGPSSSTLTLTTPISIDHTQLVGLDTHGGWAGLTITRQVDRILDTDSDGVPNHRDLDSDNDGISDLYEAVKSSPTSPRVMADVDRDGTVTRAEAIAYTGLADPDSNRNGLWDFLESAAIPVDSDGDKLPDFLDLDSDNDGIPDTVEARPSSGYVANDGDVRNDDSDGDGVIGLFDTKTGFGGSFGMPVNTDGSSETSSFQFSGQATAVTVDNSVDNVEVGVIDAGGANKELFEEDKAFAKFNSASDVLVLDMGQSLPVGATVSIRVLARDLVSGSIATQLFVEQSASNGAGTSNRRTFSFDAKDTYYNFTYTVTNSPTQYIRLTTSNSREVRLDFVSWGYGVTSSNPIPDYIDKDSDGDGELDRRESGQPLNNSDVNGDGIDDAIGASYQGKHPAKAAGGSRVQAACLAASRSRVAFQFQGSSASS